MTDCKHNWESRELTLDEIQEKWPDIVQSFLKRNDRGGLQEIYIKLIEAGIQVDEPFTMGTPEDKEKQRKLLNAVYKNWGTDIEI